MMLRSLRDLPQTVWLLAAISLLNDMASDLVYPLLPLYLASVLMAGPRVLGLIEGIADAVGSLLKLYSGVLTDRTGSSKPWMIGGYGLAAVTRPLIALASVWPVILLLRFFDRVGKGLRTSPRDTLLALQVPEQTRGLAFGFHRACDNLGAVIGPLLAALLLSRQVPLRDIFLWTAVPGALTVALVLLIREPPRRSERHATRPAWTLRGLPGRFRRYLAVLALFSLGNSTNMFLLLRARDLGLPEQQIPLLWALVSLTAALLSTHCAALSDRWGRLPLILGGWFIYGLFYLALGVNGGHLILLWPLFAFYGLFMAATEGAERALVADLVVREQMGTAYGWFNLVVGIMLLPASLLFGWLWQGFSPETAFSFAAGCALLASLLLWLWVKPVPISGGEI